MHMPPPPASVEIASAVFPIGCATSVTGIIGPTCGSALITSCAVE